MELDALLSDISDSKNWIEIEPIEIGLSGENKYHITRRNGAEIILRTSGIEHYKRHCESAKFAQYIHDRLGLNMNLPIEVAACGGDTLAYTLYTWVEGTDADTKIRNMHTPEQAKYGEKAGRLLRKIHGVSAPDDVLPWDEYFEKQIDGMLGRFRVINVHFKGDRETTEFIENHRGLLKGRPQTALHGDFRSGNLIFDRKGEFGIIDFGRWCWGDPYMDFQCVSRSCSAPFARGQINGYFDGNIPGDFFELVGLYTAVDTIRRICEAYEYGRDALGEAIAAAEKTVREYNRFEGLIPTWY
ncbi:MAG: aminoglycoside phosphotransferase family protein [Ruminiclostridium sp.]|nr:aminoglycoside phosphotransferase family protein [Ruminiclostridium sp.]